MATQQQIETRALLTVDRVLNSRASEDDFVECKAEWPTDHRKTARQLAALSNAARGEDAMWLIGVDERNAAVTTASVAELANWWPKVEKYFGDKVAPDLQNLIVATPRGDIVALNFGTGRTPYLVSTDGSGGVGFEIPIRSGNGTRTARRHELMLLLSKQIDAPVVEIVVANARAHMSSDEELAAGGRDSPNPGIQLNLSGIVFVSTTQPVTITRHRSKINVRIPGTEHTSTMEVRTISGKSNSSSVGFRELAGGFYFNASDRLDFRNGVFLPRGLSDSLRSAASISLEIELHIAGRDQPVRVKQDLVRKSPDPTEVPNKRYEKLGAWVSPT